MSKRPFKPEHLPADFPYRVKIRQRWDTHDGGGFNGTLYLGKDKVATVEDSGTGGGAWPRFANKVDEQIFADAVKALPKVDLMGGGELYEVGQSFALSMMAEEAMEMKRFKRICGNQVLFQLAGDAPGEWRGIKKKRKVGPDFMDREIIAHIRKKYGDKVDRILNEEIN